MKTLQQLCQDAINVQDASNLSGVINSFSRTMTDLREILSQDSDFSTDKLNRHSIAIMYSSKIASLTYSELGEEFSNAYLFCKDNS